MDREGVKGRGEVKALQKGFQIADPAKRSAKEQEPADAKDLLGGNEGLQVGAQVEGHPQALGKGTVEIGVSTVRLGALVATVLLVHVEIFHDFLRWA